MLCILKIYFNIFNSVSHICEYINFLYGKTYSQKLNISQKYFKWILNVGQDRQYLCGPHIYI